MYGRFLLDYPRKSGVSLRSTLESVERQSGVHDPQLDTASVPVGFEHWYYRFMELRRGDGITYQDLYAYEQVLGVKLTPIEVSAIMAMDQGASVAVGEILKESASK